MNLQDAIDNVAEYDFENDHIWGLDKVVDAARRWAAVQEAITDEGSHPRFHRHVMKRHQREWPTLWAALE